MEKKIRGVILIFIFLNIFFVGCKKEENIKKLDTSYNLYIDTTYEIFEELHKVFSNDIRELNIIEREKFLLKYNLYWKQYEVYWNKSWEELKSRLKWEFLKRNLKYSVKRFRNYNKILVSYSYFLPDNNEINLDIFYFYFPIRAKKESRKPLLAIVVDDLTEKNYWSDRLFSLSYTLNLAIIPTSKIKDLLEETKKKNWYAIMHLPMESINYPRDAKYLVSYPILKGMSKNEIEKIIDKSLKYFEDYPVEGINNHMGSKVTSDPETMRNLYEVLKEKGLFFLDSKTSYESVGRKLAKEVKISFLENDLFLDHENDNEMIRRRFQQSIEIAKRKGKAIVICHIRPKTIEVMEELEKENFFKDVELVKLEDLLQ
ncbi:MAG: divergent polysaccharide deacetylase family protein [Dictyoglomaceae bacterium]|nr:divergent polysaccharide deacetylase family protein [Dictyoglomaceae bacterium]